MGRLGLLAASAAALLLGADAGAVELTEKNFDAEVFGAGKSAFIKFLAPWWGHCKSMKPDWDKLGDKFKDSDILIADVDCTSDGGKPLCSKYGVRGYPTIKTFTGNPMGDDYKGGRKFADLVKHVETNMGPSCGPEHKDKCSAEELKELEELLKLSDSEIQAKLNEAQAEMDKASSDFEDFVKSLQSKYEEAQKAKEDTENTLAPKLKMLYAAKKKNGKDEL